MLSLTKELEHTFIYHGEKLEANLSFDNVLRWYELLEDKSLDNSQIMIISFEMFFGKESLNADLIVKAVKSISDYIAQTPYSNPDDEPAERYFSFTQDAEAIYSSFMEQYHIDLIDMQGKLHWDKFIAMFSGLNDNTYLKKIIDIRQKPTTDLKDPQLTNLINAKAFYELDSNKSVEAQEERMNDVFAALKKQAQS